MSFSVRPISPADIGAAAAMMNESSRGHGFEFRLQPIEFLFLSNLWQFSYRHSYLGWIDSEPAGVVLNCVDSANREAYSFYWGVTPRFRGKPVSMALVHTYLKQARQEGLRRTYLDCDLSGPAVIYERLGFKPTMEVTQYETDTPDVPDAAPGLVAPVELEEIRCDPGRLVTPIHWTRRPNFLEHSAPYLQALGYRDENGLTAYAVLTSRSGHTLVLDLQCDRSAAGGAAIVRYLVDHHYPTPYRFSYVPESGSASHLLQEAGFHVTKRSVCMALEPAP